MEFYIRPINVGDGKGINELRRMPGAGEEKIIGTAGLNIFSNPRLRHSASIGIMVHKDFQNSGVGTKLMEAIIDIADNWLMLVRVELAVFADNEKAINLYKKFNFEIEGLKKKESIRNGEYVDELIMGRIGNFITKTSNRQY